MVALIVDDDESCRELLTLHLRSLGYSGVRAARDGAQALRIFDEIPGQPEIVLTDIFMPEADGFEFLSGLSKRRFAGELVLFSGGDEEIFELAKVIAVSNRLNLVGTCRKPVTLEDLSTVVKRIQYQE